MLLQRSLLMKAFQGKFSAATGRQGPGLLEGHLGALDSSVLRSLLEKCVPVQRACSVILCDWAPHICIDLLLLFSMELAACRKLLLSMQRYGGCNCMSGRCFSAAISRNRKVKMPTLPV